MGFERKQNLLKVTCRINSPRRTQTVLIVSNFLPLQKLCGPDDLAALSISPCSSRQGDVQTIKNTPVKPECLLVSEEMLNLFPYLFPYKRNDDIND